MPSKPYRWVSRGVSKLLSHNDILPDSTFLVEEYNQSDIQFTLDACSYEGCRAGIVIHPLQTCIFISPPITNIWNKLCEHQQCQ